MPETPENRKAPSGRPVHDSGLQRAVAERQRRQIQRLQGERTTRLDVLNLMLNRRTEGGHRAPFRIADVPRGKETGEVLLVPFELLAERRAVDDEAAAAVVQAAGFTIEFVEALRNRVVRLKKEGASGDDVERLQTQLTSKGVRASFAYVTPNRIVMKAVATPELPVEPPRPLPIPEPDGGHGSPPRVVVIDNGVATCGRDDGWLLGLQTEANEDPLDVFPEPNTYLDMAAGHGTFVAGIVQQVDPALDLEVRRVIDSDGVASELDVACALVRAIEEGLRPGGRMVVNLSLGTETVDDMPPIALETALTIVREIEVLRAAEVLVVVAAGNEGADRKSWPAAFAELSAASRDYAVHVIPRVVAVAALTADGEPAPWSSRGSWVTCSTVGEAVVSTFVTGREDPSMDEEPETFGPNAWAYWTGTSFAAPQVAARVASIARTTGVSLAEALDTVLATADSAHEHYGPLLRPQVASSQGPAQAAG